MALDPHADMVRHLDTTVLPDDLITERLRRNEHTALELQKLLRKASLTPDDVIMVLHGMIKAKVITEEESGHLFNTMPKDNAGIRHVINHLFQVVVHAGVALRAEAKARKSKVSQPSHLGETAWR